MNIKILILLICCGLQSLVLAQVSNGPMEDIVVCGESSIWSLTTNSAGTVAIHNLPPGIEFLDLVDATCSTNLTNNNPPTFYVPQACTIRYRVTSNCETYRVRDIQQGGNPNRVFELSYSWNGTVLPAEDIDAEINAPELNFNVVTNGSPASPFTDFTRTIQICNDGLDSYLDQSMTVCFDNGTDLILSQVIVDDGNSGIPLNVNGNCVEITTDLFTHAFNRLGVYNSSDPGRLNGPNSSTTGNTEECITLNLTLNLNSCQVNGDFTQVITTNWGCNNENCAIPTRIPINANITNAIPYLDLESKLTPGDGCNLDNMFINTFTITNNGQGAAANIDVYIEPVWNFNSLYATDINRMMLDDGINPPYSIDAVADRTSTFIPNFTNTADCFDRFAALGGGTPAVSFHFTIPINLEPGQSIDVTVPMFFCCPKDCRENPYYDRWEGTMDYTNACQSSNYNFPTKILQNWFAMRNRTTPNVESNLSDATPYTFTLDINDFYLLYFERIDWPIKPFYEITFPCGIHYNGNAAVTNRVGDVLTPDIADYDPATGVLRLEWDFPFAAGDDRSWKGGQLNFDITSDCNTCGGGTKSFGVEEGFILGENCQEYCTPHRCYSFPVVLQCGNCPWPGITPKSYTLNRVNLGLTDLNDDGLPDDGSVANPNDIRVDRAIVGDTLLGTWYAESVTNIDHPFWEYAYAQTTMSGMTQLGRAVVFDATIKIFDASINDTIYCDQVDFSQTNISVADFDFSPSTLCAKGCFDLCNFVFENDDKIWLYTKYIIRDNDICWTARHIPVTVSTDLYAAEVANPPANSNTPCAECDPIIYPDTRWTCNRFTESFDLITPFVTMAAQNNFNFQGCETKWVSGNFYWGIGPGSSYFFNLFPNEYRNFGTWDTLYMSIPEGYEILDWRMRQLRGSGNGATTNNNLYAVENAYNITPDFVDTVSFQQPGFNDKFYGFLTQQYFDSNQFFPSDDGMIFTIYARLRPTCEVDATPRKPVKYIGTPNWYSAEEQCGDFGPRSDDLLTFFRPELDIQSDNPNSVGSGDAISWPLRLNSVSNPDISNAFLYIPPGSITIKDLLDSNGNPIPNTNNFFDLGAIPGPSSTTFTLNADYLSCQKDSLLVIAGWDCSEIPSNIEDYECDRDSIYLYLNPALPSFNLAILQPTINSSYDLCSTIPFEFQYRNVGQAVAFNMNSYIFLPQANANIVPGSLEIEYPCGSGYKPWSGNIPSPIQVPLGSLWALDITGQSQLNNQIDPLGVLPDNGWAYPDLSGTDNCFNIRFDIDTECGFEASQDYVRTLLVGYGPCAANGDQSGLVTGEVENAASINITGTDPYTMDLKTIWKNKVYACSDNETLNISLQMLGPGQTKPGDKVEVRIPVGFNYVSNTGGLTPTVTTVDQVTVLEFPITTIMNVGDRLNFDVELSLDKLLLECGRNNIIVKSNTQEQAHCVTDAPGTTCPITSTTALESIFFGIEKPDLAVNINSANATCASRNLIVEAEIAIRNSSSINVPIGESFTVDIFANEDGSCSYNGNNILLQTLTIDGPFSPGQIKSYNTSFTMPFEVCDILVKINDCVCGDDGQDCTTLELTDLPANNYDLCYPYELQIESCYNPQASYQWKAIPPALDFWFDGATDIYNPSLTLPDPGISVQTFYYEVDIDRGRGCRTTDIVAITVSPEILFDAGPDKYVCGSETQLEGDIFGAVGIWSHSSGPGFPSIDSPNAPDTECSNLLPGTHTFRWTVLNQDACNNGDFDEVVLEVVEAPVINVSTVCTVQGNNSVYHYTIEVEGNGIPGTFSISGNDNELNLAYDVVHGPYGPVPAENVILNLFIENDLGHCERVQSFTNVDCPKFDFGDLPDTGAGTGIMNYETLNGNNGPCHRIISGLYIKDFIDDEGDALQNQFADGDGEDEDGFLFMNFLEAIKGAAYKLPLQINNSTGEVAHLEAWVDWNGDGDFDDQGEFVFDLNDDGAGNFGQTSLELEIPDFAVENQPIGFRVRLGLQNSMTPYGKITDGGEVEDYMFTVIRNEEVCLPLLIQVEN